MSGEEEARQNGTNGRVRMAATAFMRASPLFLPCFAQTVQLTLSLSLTALANSRIEPSETFPRPDTPMRQLQPPPMPLASSSSGSATRQPPSKRARRVLATEEEMKEWESEKGRTKNGVADRETEMEEGAETSVEGTKQKARPTGKTGTSYSLCSSCATPLTFTPAARLPPDPHPPPARPIAATPKTFRPLTAFGLSPSLTTSTSKPTASSSSRTAARPAPVSALGRVPLPLPPPGRPKTPTTPREAESKPAKPLANLSSLLPARSPSTPKDKGEERKPILALAPPASILASRATGDDAEVEEGEDEWSPRKKGRGKGYIQCVSLLSPSLPRLIELRRCGTAPVSPHVPQHSSPHHAQPIPSGSTRSLASSPTTPRRGKSCWNG